jgi:copper chaperone
MKELKFKTNINCGGCVAKVTPALNEAVGEGHWKVDTNHPDKILTVDGAEVKKIVYAVVKSGYRAEKL